MTRGFRICAQSSSFLRQAVAEEDADVTKHVLFVHGAGEGAYAEDSKLVAHLSEKLGHEYTVRYPRMPNEADAEYPAWKRQICKELAVIGDGAILVGHSVGGSVLIRLLADRDLQQSVAGLFLVATPFWYDHEVWRWDDVRLPKNVATLLPNALPLYLYHGREDEVAPVAHVDMYAELLPQATVRRLDGRNHQLNEDLSEVALDIRELH